MKRDFRIITKEIKDGCLCWGYGIIRLDTEQVKLWIEDYDTYDGTFIHVDSITIEYDIITLFENGSSFIKFDNIKSINKQIEIYETIYKERKQLTYYELDWENTFNVQRVVDDEGNSFLWRILSEDEARHLFYNGQGELFEIYDDGAEGVLDNEARFKECIEYGGRIGVEIL